MKNEGARRPAAEDEMREGAGGHTAIAAFTAMMDERRQLEGWIEALDGRRATTPAHVFERVHADYASRLHAVVERLREQSAAVNVELAALGERFRELNEQALQASDERAEAELRAHVGELSAAEWETTSAASDALAARLASELDALKPTLERNRALLNEATRPPATRATASSPVVAHAVDDAADASLHLPAAVEGDASVQMEADLAPSAEPEREVSAQMLAAEAELMDLPESLMPAPPMAGSTVAARTPGFDELAFLSSVVDTPAGSMDAGPTERPDERTRRDSFATRAQDGEIENLDDAVARSIAPVARPGGAPLGGNVTGNVPIILADTPGGGKTLKCSECSAMNYPTEWYCERCGAELASL